MKLKEIVHKIRSDYPNATEAESLALFRSAVRDDPEAIEEMITQVMDDMVAFDPERANKVMRAVTENDPDALALHKALLKDMQRH